MATKESASPSRSSTVSRATGHGASPTSTAWCIRSLRTRSASPHAGTTTNADPPSPAAADFPIRSVAKVVSIRCWRVSAFFARSMASTCCRLRLGDKRSQAARTRGPRLPDGSVQFLDVDHVACGIAKVQLRIPDGYSIGSWTTSAPLACSRLIPDHNSFRPRWRGRIWPRAPAPDSAHRPGARAHRRNASGCVRWQDSSHRGLKPDKTGGHCAPITRMMPMSGWALGGLCASSGMRGEFGSVARV